MTKTIFLVTLTTALIVSGDLPCRSQEQRPSQFDQWDKNEDGRLSRDELPERLRPNFDRVDADDDGVISREEDAAVRRGGQRQPRAERNPTPEGVRVQRDVPYAGTDNPRQCVDLILPEKPAGEGPLPVIVWIHGGGWRGGDKRGGTRQLAALVASGNYAGVSVGYRLSDEATWPAQIHDCKAAIRWIRANAKKHNFDAQRIGVWGSSAGGHLVAMLGTSGGVKDLEGDLGDQADRKSTVSCVVDYFGPTELLTMSLYPSRIDHDSPDSPESLLVGGPLKENKQAARSASPLAYVSDDDPPILIVHGTEDQLVPLNQSERLDTALRQAGVDVTFIRVDGGGHGGFDSQELLRRVGQFFDKHLRDVEVEVAATPIRQGQE